MSYFWCIHCDFTEVFICYYCKGRKRCQNILYKFIIILVVSIQDYLLYYYYSIISITYDYSIYHQSIHM